jgi:hypothetical protein
MKFEDIKEGDVIIDRGFKMIISFFVVNKKEEEDSYESIEFSISFDNIRTKKIMNYKMHGVSRDWDHAQQLDFETIIEGIFNAGKVKD